MVKQSNVIFILSKKKKNALVIFNLLFDKKNILNNYLNKIMHSMFLYSDIPGK